VDVAPPRVTSLCCDGANGLCAAVVEMAGHDRVAVAAAA
jgi:hypothetical protein